MLTTTNQETDYLARAIAVRRALHSEPELAYAEHKTAERVAGWLRALGMDVQRGLGGTGVVGVLRRGTSSRMIGLRADMDALPIREQTGLPYASQREGCMHACGHDGHVAMLLSAASMLAAEGGFDGQVAFIFQPAEERGAGAEKMISEGLFERYPVESVYALHNWPELPEGQFAMRSGAVMGAGLRFRITVNGRGTHAAFPNRGVDPVPVVCSIVQSLQTLVSREFSPIQNVVVSVTQLGGGAAQNAVPDTAWLAGTARFCDEEVRLHLREAMQRYAHAIAQAHRASADVDFEEGYPATINSAPEAAVCASVLREVFGPERVIEDLPVSLTSEDFSYMLAARPGTYALLGTGRGVEEPGLHHPAYDFNDSVLKHGMDYWVALTRRLLPTNG